MPNWCNNTVQITGPNKKIKEIKKAIKAGGFLQYLYPMPAELEGTTADGSMNKKLKEKFGYSDWYEWRTNEWSTKWEVTCDYSDPSVEEFSEQSEGESQLVWSFDSAWSPPIGAYDHYLAENSDVSIFATYYEPGCDFMGVWDSGDDRCYNPGDYKSDDDFWTTDDGQTLDDNYGIVEQKAEWEEEQLDEGTKKVRDYVDGQPQNLDQLHIGEEN